MGGKVFVLLMVAVLMADMMALEGVAYPVCISTVNPAGGVEESIQCWAVLSSPTAFFCSYVRFLYVSGGYNLASGVKLPYIGAMGLE